MKGTGVSPGISIGRARWVTRQRVTPTGIRLDGNKAVAAETARFQAAIVSAVAEIEALINTSQAGAAAILETHISLITDPQLENDVLEQIEGERKNAVDAVHTVISRWAEMFSNMEDVYFQERAVDIEDVGGRIVKHLVPPSSIPLHDQITGKAPYILLAEDLTPTETITMDLSQVAGLALIAGGKTSHAAILARMRGLPAIVGCGEDLLQIKDDDELILDGATGEIHIHPTTSIKEIYQQKQAACSAHTQLLAALKDRPAVTTDGAAIHLMANISKTEDMQEVTHHGGEGVGLFRTEFLYMERSSFPTEEEQFLYYRDLALRSGSRPLTIRTLDIGGDKPLPYFPLPKEDNPFLGYRAIRISLDRTDIFLTQLKAILRAGVFGKIKILLPMVGDLLQLRTAKALLEEARQQLKAEGVPYNADIPVGIMIEVPSAALIADVLAKEADFFSIGTNDLCQYTLAADRLHQHIGALYDPYHPAVLRLIHTVLQQAQEHNTPVSLCGEMAADPLATLLLAGMGLQEFSMNASSIPSIKNIIINNSLEKAKTISSEVMGLTHSADIIQYLQEVNK